MSPAGCDVADCSLNGHGRSQSYHGISVGTGKHCSAKTTSEIGWTERSSEWDPLDKPFLTVDRVMHTLICSLPFAILPLHIRCFTEYAHSILDALPPRHLEYDVKVILDLGGVSGSTGRRRQSTSGATSQDGPIDVLDSDFRGQVWSHWVAVRETIGRACSICTEHLDITVSPHHTYKG